MIYDRRVTKRGRYELIGKWSNKYDCCVKCRRVSRPHKAKGYCTICYYYKNKGRNKKI